MPRMPGMLSDEDKLHMLDLRRRDNAEEMRMILANQKSSANDSGGEELSAAFLLTTWLAILVSFYFLFQLLKFVIQFVE